MKLGYAIFALLALIIIGCGGGGEGTTGTTATGTTAGGGSRVSGIIFDEEGLPVRDARVFVDGIETRSNSNGVYLLSQVPVRDALIRADVSRDGVRYQGQNVVRVLRDQQVMNHNIAVYPASSLGSIHGFARDREGQLLRGVRVFVKQVAENTVLSSAYGITGEQGEYDIGGLRSGMDYDVQANASGFGSDFDSFTLATGERRRLDFALPNGSVITLNPPTNVVATAWTSPRATRDPRFSSVLANMKQIVNPNQKKRSTTRTTTGGHFVEIDIVWDPIFDNSLLGFGIYRAQEGQALRDIYFLRDPLSEIFADLDDALREGRTYNYQVTTLSTSFDGTAGQSQPSELVSARPLGDLVLGPVTATQTPTVRWQRAFEADEYIVYFFDQYPSIGVQDFFNNENNPVTGTSFTYNGAPLARGRTYFYLVLGLGNGGSLTLSPVGQIIVP